MVMAIFIVSMVKKKVGKVHFFSLMYVLKVGAPAAILHFGNLPTISKMVTPAEAHWAETKDETSVFSMMSTM